MVSIQNSGGRMVEYGCRCRCGLTDGEGGIIEEAGRPEQWKADGRGPPGKASQARVQSDGASSAVSAIDLFYRNKGFLLLLLFCLWVYCWWVFLTTLKFSSKFLLIFNHSLIYCFICLFLSSQIPLYYNLGLHHFTIGQFTHPILPTPQNSFCSSHPM